LLIPDKWNNSNRPSVHRRIIYYSFYFLNNEIGFTIICVAFSKPIFNKHIYKRRLDSF